MTTKMLSPLFSQSGPIVRGARQALAVPLLCLLIVSLRQAYPAAEALELGTKSDNSPIQKQQQQQHQQQQSLNIDSSSSSRKNSLEAELDNILQQRDSFDLSDRSLAEAIISRLMVDDLANELSTTESLEAEELAGDSGSFTQSSEQQQQQPQQQPTYFGRAYSGPADALRLKKLLSMVQAYETSLPVGSGVGGVGSMAAPLPMLPAGQAATSKRAAAKLAGSYQQQHQGNGGGGPTAYGQRSSFDFGLGKRPDTTGASSNLLRLGDSLSGGGGIQTVNQFGKRPSAHRYDFGLGKRVASVSNSTIN